MFALPGQTMTQWKDTVEQAITLKPEHISCYSLIVEDGTPFGDRHSAGELTLPGEDAEAAMYEWVIERLGKAGYEQYEISNFALPGFRCAHNQIYWHNQWYLGLGPGAHSHWAGQRYANERGLSGYNASLAAGRLPVTKREQLSCDEQMDETLIMGLRLLDGVDEDSFQRRFGQKMIDVYGHQINRLIGQGLLQYDGAIARLTSHGLLLGNQVFAEFLR
jgi:oxygen-independent coproporphyrinogen-3 oxidase